VWSDDLTAALATAKAENRPVFVTLRCLPCKQCSAFDKDVEYANQHKRIAPVQTGSQTVDGVTAVQFTLDVLGKTARGVYIIKGGRLYVLYAVDASDTDLARFLAAFHAIGK
jgi:hypothetical protein